MSKLIAKTILNTLLGILAGVVLIWGVISLAFPGLLVEPTKNMGMIKVSAWYAASSYVRTGDLDDLAEATEMCIYTSNEKQIVKYGSIFIRMDGFDEYCASRNETYGSDYKQYIYGHLSVSYYHLGQADKAVETAFSALPETFESNNAVYALTLEALSAKDKETCILIRQELFAIGVGNSADYTRVLGWLNAVIDSSAS